MNQYFTFRIWIFVILIFAFASCSKTNGLVVVEKTSNLGNKENVIAKLNQGGYIKIACEGTSLTYGEDINGTDTVTSYLPNAPTQAIFQYPTSMLKALNNPHMSLSLRGYPGDRTTEAITRWQDSTTADICIIEYGTNDAYNFGSYASGKVDVNTYKAQLRLLVKRRIDEGAWVIICLPPLLQTGDGALNEYRDAAKKLAHDFYVPVFDVEPSVKSISQPYSDLVHLNSRSYQKWGNDIAGIVGEVTR